MKKTLYRTEQVEENNDLDIYFDGKDLENSIERFNHLFGIDQQDLIAVQFFSQRNGVMVRLPGDSLFRSNVATSTHFNPSWDKKKRKETVVDLFRRFAEAEYCFTDLALDDSQITEYFQEAARRYIENLTSDKCTFQIDTDFGVGLLRKPKDPELAGVIANIRRMKELQYSVNLPEERVIELIDREVNSLYHGDNEDEFGLGVPLDLILRNPEKYQLVIRHSGWNFDRFVLDPSDNVYKDYFDHYESLDGIDTQSKLINLIVSLGYAYYERPSINRYRDVHKSDSEFKKAIFYHNLILNEYRDRSYFPIIETELFRYRFIEKSN